MSYVGSTPTTQNFIAGTDQFTGNGSSTNWTLSRFVNSTNDIQVTIANVVQNPTSYSVSGNTLTISPAVSNGTAIYVRYLSTTLQSITIPPGSAVNGTFLVAQDTYLATQSGSVGVGTLLPSQKVSVGASVGSVGYGIEYTPTDQEVFSLTANTATGEVRHFATTNYFPTFWANNAERARIDSSGNFMIGATAANGRLHVANASATSTTVASNIIASLRSNASGADVSLQFSDNVANASYIGMVSSALYFAPGGTERARIDVNGNLLVGTTSTATPPAATTSIFAGGLFLNPSLRTAANAASAYWEASTGAFFRSTSSLRYKTNVQDYTKGLDAVLKLRPVSFNPKDGDKQDRTFAGFIAEEVDSLGLNEFVEYDADGLPDSVGYAQITAILTKAIQELNAKVDAQAAEIAALKGAANGN